MTYLEELLEQLEHRLDYWQRRMSMCGWEIQFEPIIEPEEGAWAFILPEESGCKAKLPVHPGLPEELIDWVLVHSLAHLMLCPLHRCIGGALKAVAGLAPEAERERSEMLRVAAGDPVSQSEERLVQRICDAVLRREHTFLVDAWFAQNLYRDFED